MDAYGEIRELLNREHKEYGYGVSAICRLFSKEYGFKLNLKYKISFIVTDESTIEMNKNIITLDMVCVYLSHKGIM